MTDVAVSPEDQKKAERAAKERERRAAKKAEQEAAKAAKPVDPEKEKIRGLIARAREIAPGIKSPYQPAEMRSMIEIVGKQDPVEFLTKGFQGEELAGRNVRDVINAWACGELETADPAAVALRARVREIGNDPRAKNLWGRKVGAFVLALDESQAA